MSRQSEELSLRRARLLTVMLMIVVAVAIALANLSSEPVTLHLLDSNKPERAYGWPLTWYWRSATRVPGKLLQWHATRVPFSRLRLQWPVSRYSVSCLTANLATWLVKLVTSSVACEWLLRRYRPRLNWRPRVTTIFVLMIVSAPTLLANFSFDVVGTPSPPYMMERWVTKASFGWPLTWYWCVLVNGKGLGLFRGWDYSAVRLAGNLVIWLLMFTVVGLTWEWRSRRYWPQLRWSLRTMLVAVGLVAVVCAWCAAARNRAQEQDALIALAGDHNVWVERWGPKWLDLVGADRFRQLPWSRASFLVQLGDVNASRAVERRTARSAKLAGAAGELVCKLLMP